jgi:hypothetical protein
MRDLLPGWGTQARNAASYLRMATGDRPDDPPVVGHLILNEESLRLPDDPGQRLIFSGAEPGTSSFERLRLLGSLSS